MNKKRKKDVEIEELLGWKKWSNFPAEIFEFFDFSKTTDVKKLKLFHKEQMKNKKIKKDSEELVLIKACSV